MPSEHAKEEDARSATSSTTPKEDAPMIPPPPPPPRDILVGPVLFILMSFVAFVFTVVSIGIPWYSREQYKPSGGPSVRNYFYLFKSTIQVEGAATVTQHTNDIVCKPVQARLKALEAFAIVSAVFTCLTFVISIPCAYFQYSKPKESLRTTMLVLCALAMAFLTVEVSLNFNIYLWSFAACGAGSSYHSQFYEPAAGFGLTVTAWVLIGLGGIIAANRLTIPLDARTVDQGIHTFTLLSLLALLLSTVSCPLVHWFYKDHETFIITDVLLWRMRHGYPSWVWGGPSRGPFDSFWVKDYGCDELIQYFRATEAFSVASILFMALSSTTGLLLWKSLAGTRLPSVIFSYLAVVVNVVQLALELRIYYGSWCGGKYAFHKEYYVLAPGFALMASSLCLMVVASVAITVAYHLTSRYFPAKIPGKTVKQVAIEECH